MQFPKLTPLQSRFAASLLASAILLVLYITITKPHFAYAAEVDSRISPDHNHPILVEDSAEVHFLSEEDDEDGLTQVLQSRASAGTSALANNAPQNMNIRIGESQNWVFPKDAVTGPHGVTGPGLPSIKERDIEPSIPELRKRQSTARVYITLNTCLQPKSNTSDLNSTDAIPPQLQMYLSLTDQNPGPSSTNQQVIPVDGGYALATVDANNDVYIGIAAPNGTNLSGIWNYEIAASIDAPYHGANGSWANLFFVDADNHAALLITNDTTQANPNDTVYQTWMTMSPPYGIFAHNQADRSILGVKNSYCGLMNNARIMANVPGVNNQNVAKMTNRGLGGKPKEQFYIQNLNTSSTYWGFLAMAGNSTAAGNGVVGGGGKIWAAMNFTTKSADNCALMYNLSFCSEVAYAVPTNPKKFDPATGLAQLAAIYDQNAASLYQNFNYSLQQIPCNASSNLKYSLVRGCDDCARAYKQWLCAVTIPRCTDFTSTDPWLMPRDLGQPFANGSSIDPQFGGTQQLLNAVGSNSSRNPIIDDQIQPGPYKELLPCEDLCYDLVQSCPATFQFGCPSIGSGFESSYGHRSADSGTLTCSYLGAAYYLSGAERISGLHLINTLAVTLLTTVILMF